MSSVENNREQLLAVLPLLKWWNKKEILMCDTTRTIIIDTAKILKCWNTRLWNTAMPWSHEQERAITGITAACNYSVHHPLPSSESIICINWCVCSMFFFQPLCTFIYTIQGVFALILPCKKWRDGSMIMRWVNFQNVFIYKKMTIGSIMFASNIVIFTPGLLLVF